MAAWIYSPARQEATVVSESSFDTSLPADERIEALELAVSQERMARQLLQEEVLYLTDALDSLVDTTDNGSEGPSDETSERMQEATLDARRERFARRNSPEGRIEQMIQAGIDPGLASWIIQREEELQMADLRARYEAGQSGDPLEFYRLQTAAGNTLRDELGDASYERYLVANGRPISVSVSSVIGSSPAQAAGVRPGDEITSYNGERVFSMTDINLASMDGTAGENVILDIVREGVPMQVVIPRGPLGISGGRSRGPR
jgi:hypothetical protein